eukprot:jgi/Mesen1/10539/ME000083S10050
MTLVCGAAAPAVAAALAAAPVAAARWVEEYRLDGFHFHSLPSMLYTHNGASSFAGGLQEYFNQYVDNDAIRYLILANDMLRELLPDVITIADDVRPSLPPGPVVSPPHSAPLPPSLAPPLPPSLCLFARSSQGEKTVARSVSLISAAPFLAILGPSDLPFWMHPWMCPSTTSAAKSGGVGARVRVGVFTYAGTRKRV